MFRRSSSLCFASCPNIWVVGAMKSKWVPSEEARSKVLIPTEQRSIMAVYTFEFAHAGSVTNRQPAKHALMETHKIV